MTEENACSRKNLLEVSARLVRKKIQAFLLRASSIILLWQQRTLHR